MNVGLVLAVAVLATTPGTHHSGGTSPPATPSPVVSVPSGNPVLTEQSPVSWTTTVVLDETPACLKNLSFQLVTTSPDYLVKGAVKPRMVEVDQLPASGVVELGPGTLLPLDGSRLPKTCAPSPSGVTEVLLTFPLHTPFSAVPLGATLVIDDPGGTVPAVATQLMTVRALVTGWQYLWFPLIYGGVLVALFLIAVGLIALWRLVRKGKPAPGRGFWRRPVYASAAWTFADSPATNISALGTVLAAILTAVGATSTLLPGIQADHFAVLIAVCAAIVAAAPLAFGIINTWCARSRGSVPDNASLRFVGPVRLDAPAGASLSFSGQAEAQNSAHARVFLKPGGTVPVPPGSQIEITLGDTGAAVFPGDSSIVLKGASQVEIDAGQGEITVPADALAAPAAARPRRVGPRLRAGAQPPPVTLGSGLPIKPAQTQDGVTVKAVGFVAVTVPRGTSIKYPFPDDGTERRFTGTTVLRVPMGSNVIAADMRSLLPASMVTIFGIGAQLGLLTILGSELSAVSGSVHLLAKLVVGAMAAVTLIYAVISMIALASSRPGSALASDSRTSYIL